MSGVAAGAAERGLVPDPLSRIGIRRLLARRLQQEGVGDPADERRDRRRDLVAAMSAGPIALFTDEANEQHYELPPRFFELMLGPRRKYSCCRFDDLSSPMAEAAGQLAAAEDAMLAATGENAQLEDGMRLLDLGCGWGSLTLYVAEQFPACRITAVSNSGPQRAYIEARAAERGWSERVTVRTADINDLALTAGDGAPFDRVISVEMFEHMRNWRALLERVSTWLSPDGRALIHVFCHRELPYLFEPRHDDDWMARHFFTGGLMPSADLLSAFGEHLEVEDTTRFDGRHYQRTSEAWLARLDANREEALALCREVYGADDAERWLRRWRLFHLACAELFGAEGGAEWFVQHYRLRPATA
ncbi:MAG: cyclopropane-fatty-acyl-phospholipid synthase family protein [Actinomycetota bacterium]